LLISSADQLEHAGLTVSKPKAQYLNPHWFHPVPFLDYLDWWWALRRPYHKSWTGTICCLIFLLLDSVFHPHIIHSSAWKIQADLGQYITADYYDQTNILKTPRDYNIFIVQISFKY
jgi:hypothetical protein